MLLGLHHTGNVRSFGGRRLGENLSAQQLLFES
jgi:hypothetical protein